jgi:hypothetical protein
MAVALRLLVLDELIVISYFQVVALSGMLLLIVNEFH